MPSLFVSTSTAPTDSKRHDTELRICRGIMHHIPPERIRACAGAINLEAIYQFAIISHQAQHLVTILHKFAYNVVILRAPAVIQGLRFLRLDRNHPDPGADHHVPVAPRLWVGRAVAVGAFMYGPVKRDATTAAEDWEVEY